MQVLSITQTQSALVNSYNARLVTNSLPIYNEDPNRDLAVNCHPNITAKILRENGISLLEYGKQFGTITAVIEKKNNHREDITSHK